MLIYSHLCNEKITKFFIQGRGNAKKQEKNITNKRDFLNILCKKFTIKVPPLPTTAAILAFTSIQTIKQKN